MTKSRLVYLTASGQVRAKDTSEHNDQSENMKILHLEYI